MSRELYAPSSAYYVQCNRCPATSPLCVYDSDAAVAAQILGWAVGGDEHEGDLCPACVDDLHGKDRD